MTRNSLQEVGVGDSKSRESTPVRWGPRVILVVEWAVAAVLSLVLAAYMLLGIFTRPLADDYAAALGVRELGFWAEQIAHYQQWSGRFASQAAVTAAASLNDAFPRALPAILITCWIAVLMLALKQLLPRLHRIVRLLLALEIVYTTVHLTPSPFLSIYWMTGSLTYVLPLILTTALLAIVLRRKATGRGSGIASLWAPASWHSSQAEPARPTWQGKPSRLDSRSPQPPRPYRRPSVENFPCCLRAWQAH
jgi:hypothetical protein